MPESQRKEIFKEMVTLLVKILKNAHKLTTEGPPMGFAPLFLFARASRFRCQNSSNTRALSPASAARTLGKIYMSNVTS